MTTSDPSYHALNGAVCFDLSARAALALTGKDRASLLHNFCTNEIIKCPVGSGCEAFLTSNQAKILAWLQVLVEPERLLVTAEPGLAQKIITYLDRFIIAEDVQLADLSGDLGCLHLAGPQAAAILGSLLGQPLEMVKDRQHRTLNWQAQPLLVERRHWLGTEGYHLFAPKSNLPDLNTALLERGAAAGDFTLYEALRLEAGVPEYGRDLDESNLPQEANRTDAAISFTKGCYLGQETVARIRAYGHVNRLLVPLKLSAEFGTPSAAWATRPKLISGGKELGELTSIAWSPLLAAPLALGFVRRGHEKVSTQLQVELAGVAGTAEVINVPRKAEAC